jgi:hypothetical protein
MSKTASREVINHRTEISKQATLKIEYYPSEQRPVFAGLCSFKKGKELPGADRLNYICKKISYAFI